MGQCESRESFILVFVFYKKDQLTAFGVIAVRGGGRTNARRPSSLHWGSAGIGEPFLLPLVNLMTIIANKLNRPSDTGVAGK